MENGDIFGKIRGDAPSELLDFFRQLLPFFPDEFKYRLKRVIDALPPEGDNMHKILDLVRSEWKDIQSQEWIRIAVVGPSQTGKTSLVAAIRGKQSGTGAPIFTVVEIPGLDEYLGYERERAVPSTLRETDVILLVLDARYGVSAATVQMYQRLQHLDKPILVVLNKMDLVQNTSAALREAKARLKNVFPVSALNHQSIDRLLAAIVSTESKALYPLTQTFPEFRRPICNGIVTRAALASCLVAALDIPVSDLLPMTAIQTAMLLKIARAFGFRLSRERARELIPMLVAGTLVREASHRLRRHFPAQKTLIAASLASVWTFLLGKAAIGYFERSLSLPSRSQSSAATSVLAAETGS
ncbi:MAG: GTP-binding protein [Acidobacteriota bacterium]